jgi:hypothetical protein
MGAGAAAVAGLGADLDVLPVEAVFVFDVREDDVVLDEDDEDFDDVLSDGFFSEVLRLYDFVLPVDFFAEEDVLATFATGLGLGAGFVSETFSGAFSGTFSGAFSGSFLLSAASIASSGVVIAGTPAPWLPEAVPAIPVSAENRAVIIYRAPAQAKICVIVIILEYKEAT